jgi:hypothetical protein
MAFMSLFTVSASYSLPTHHDVKTQRPNERKVLHPIFQAKEKSTQ